MLIHFNVLLNCEHSQSHIYIPFFRIAEYQHKKCERLASIEARVKFVIGPPEKRIYIGEVHTGYHFKKAAGSRYSSLESASSIGSKYVFQFPFVYSRLYM